MNRPAGTKFEIFAGEVPYLTTDQMREVDRAMIEDFKIDLVQMMENAGRNLADLARARFLNGDPQSRKVTALAGTGGNGGGSLVCARWLHNRGALVTVFAARPGHEFTPVPAHQLEILRRMQVDVSQAGGLDSAERPELIIDGVIGYSLQGAPRGAAADIIRRANGQGHTSPRIGRAVRRGHYHGRCLRPGHQSHGNGDPGFAQGRTAWPSRGGPGRRVIPGRHRRTAVALRRSHPGSDSGQHISP
ncbi:MAG: hypothetical protein DSY79_02065 [Chloroflexi bacterium]|nr:MAG: hypothetical protein DSY79_02065 [Chloroflexota bacterium]